MSLKKRHDEYEDWYSQIKVKYEIAEKSRRRESVFLVPSWFPVEETKKSMHMLNISLIPHIDFYFSLLKVQHGKMYNIYHSIAKYKFGIPRQQFKNWGYRKEKNKIWRAKHQTEMVGYDLFIDIDSPDHEHIDYARGTAFEVTKLFDYLNVPYEIIFSGCGFHIVIPSCYLPKLSFIAVEDSNIYDFNRFIAEKLKDEFSDLIDVSIYDSRRICKTPFSLAVYEEQSYVCLPLMDRKELTNFNLEDYRPENVKSRLSEINRKIFNPKGIIDRLVRYMEIKI